MIPDDTPVPRPVLFVMAALEPSGAESMLLALAPLLRRDGMTGVILSTGEEGVGSFAPTLAAAGYRVEHLPFTRSALFIRNFWHLCRTLRPAVVHIHCERANVWLGLAARLAVPESRIIRTVHAVFPFHGLLRLRRTLQRLLLRQLGVVTLAHSAAVARTERDRFGNPAEVIAPWIDLDRFAAVTAAARQAARERFGIADRARVLAVVGSCQPVKNHALLLEAVADAVEGIDCVVLHAGTGPCEQHEQMQARQLGLDEKVKFLGPVSDVRQVLAASDLFVMPSEREGFGLAALEALACGIPALLSSGSGLESFGVFGEAVFWCPPERAALADQIRLILSMPLAQLQAHAENAPARARQLFSAEKSWQHHKELYALQDRQDISCRLGP